MAWLPWLVLATLWFLLFKQLWLEWSTDENYSYGYVVPILAAYLFSKRWVDRPAPATSHSAGADRTLLALLALPTLLLFPLRVVQESAPEWHYVSWAMAAAIIGITLGLIGYRGGFRWVAHFAFPVAFIFTAVHWPTLIEDPLTQRLMRIDTASAVFLLHWMGVPAIQNGNVINAGGNLVGVSEACSGIRSLQITVMISLFFGELYRFDLIRRALLFLLVGVVALTCNLGRTFLLVWISVNYGDATMEKWHDTVGLGVLAVSLASFAGIAICMDASRTRSLPPTGIKGENTAIPTPPRPQASPQPWPTGFMVALGAWLILAEAGTELWYRAHESSTPIQPAWTVNWPESAPGFQNQAISDLSRALLKYTTGRHASWPDVGGNEWSVFFFQWAPGRTSSILARMHRPETCLPSLGCHLIRDETPITKEVHGVKILFHPYLFEQGGRPLHVWWALWDGAETPTGRVTSEGANEPGYILSVALSGQRNLGQQVLEIVLANEADDGAANAALERLLPQLIKR